MALFRKFFYRKPPDGLLEITERVYGAFAPCPIIPACLVNASVRSAWKLYMHGRLVCVSIWECRGEYVWR
jgi:hypothetical protein